MKGDCKEQSVQKRRSLQIIRFLFLFMLFLFTVTQLISPTGASFNDVTMIEGTISTDETFMNVENSDDAIIQEMEGDKQEGEKNPSTVFDNQEESGLYSEKVIFEDQLSVSPTDRGENDNENEGESDFKLD